MIGVDIKGIPGVYPGSIRCVHGSATCLFSPAFVQELLPYAMKVRFQAQASLWTWSRAGTWSKWKARAFWCNKWYMWIICLYTPPKTNIDMTNGTSPFSIGDTSSNACFFHSHLSFRGCMVYVQEEPKKACRLQNALFLSRFQETLVIADSNSRKKFQAKPFGVRVDDGWEELIGYDLSGGAGLCAFIHVIHI